MKSTLAVCAALATFLVVAPGWAQSLTPIQGWVPLGSPQAKVLMHDDTAKPVSGEMRDATAR